MTKPTDNNDQAPDIVIHDDSPAQRLPVVIRSQYIKDLSFESPFPPGMKRGNAPARPAMEVDFSMDAKRIDADDEKGLYEVIIGTHVVAKRGEQVTFLVELKYGMLVSLEDIPEDRVHPILLIEMPRFAFPFIRQIVSDVTQQAGYAPVFLSPVDFKAFYAKHFSGKEKAA